MEAGYTEIFAWGKDHQGQLGLGSKDNSKCYSVPRFCSFNVFIKQISCGDEHSAFITNNGLIYTIGSNQDGKLGIDNYNIGHSSAPCLVEVPHPACATHISCGQGHTAVTFEDGALYSWGEGEFGALGTGDRIAAHRPVQVSLPPSVIAQNVSCGSRHTAIVTLRGEVFTCGFGDAGQLGNGRLDTEFRFAPIQINEEVCQVACGVYHTGMLTRSGSVYMTGGNTFGQLGIGSTQGVSVPTLVRIPQRISKIAAGSHSAAISDSGELYLWGTGVFGEFLTPQKMTSLSTPLAGVDVGGTFGSAIDVKGVVWTWGSNTSGELAVGDNDPRVTPYPVMAIQGKKVTQVSCGSSFALALGMDIPSGSRRNRSEVPQSQLRVKSSRKSNQKSPLRRRSPPKRASQQSSPSISKMRTSSATPIRSQDPGSLKIPSHVHKPLSSSVSPLQHKPLSSNVSPLQLRQVSPSRPIKNYLVDLKHELRRLHEGAGGIDEISRMFERIQQENDQLQRARTGDLDNIQRLEFELSQAKLLADRQAAEANDRQGRLVEQYDSKLLEVTAHLENVTNQLDIARDQGNRSNAECGHALNENDRLQLILSDVENTKKAAEMTAENAERKYVDLSRQYDNLNDEKYSKEHQNYELTDALRREQDNFAGAQARYEDLSREKANLLAVIGDLKLQVDRLNATLNDSKCSNDYANVQLGTVSDKANMLERDLAETSNRLHQTQSAADAANSQNETLRREINSIETTVANLQVTLTECDRDRSAAQHVCEDLRRQLDASLAENEILRQNVADVEAKNKKIFAALEKSLADKARDYKEHTVDILNASPMRHGLDDRPHSMAKSPLIEKYAPRSSMGSRVSSQPRSPVHRGRSHNASPMKTPEPFTPNDPQPPLDRAQLSVQHVSRMQKSAEKITGEDPGHGPLEDFRVSSPVRKSMKETRASSTSAQMRSNLDNIKSKLASLQQNKTDLQDKMVEFETRLERP